MADLANHTLSMGRRPALLLVDLSVGFTDAASPLGCECSEIIAANAQLLATFRQHRLPVFFSTVVYRQASEASVFREKIPALNILAAGSPWVAIDERVKPQVGEVLIEKCWASAFFATDLNEQLVAAQVDSLVVTGLTTSGCVRATAVDGLQYNFSVTVVRDAVADRNSDTHRANLFDLQAKYAQVRTVAEVIAAISTVEQQA